MADPTDLIPRADIAMDGVTPGPWTFKVAANGDCVITAPGCSVVVETFADIRHAGEGAREEAKANAYFMLHARQLVPALRDALAAALTRAEAAECHAESLEAERDRLRGIVADGASLIRGDAVGAEWKRGCATFLRRARAALNDEPQQ